MQQNSGDLIAFRQQDFYSTRNWCLNRGYLFEDPYFTIDNKYTWVRPWQITDDPKLFVGGITRADVIQGELGDCWMLASISALGEYPDLVRQIIPSDQSFTSQYAGIFHIRLWRFGRWYDVVIDDRLPTRNGRLVYLKSASQNEFWTCFLEKAYCKILGGNYQVSDAGNLCEGLEDFTGGVVEQFLLRGVPQYFDSFLVKCVGRGSLVGCFIDDVAGSSEGKTVEGLVRGHSYTVTAAANVDVPGYGSVVLVRVRNPWGQFEWTGPWSDNSPEWQSIPEATKQQLGLVKRDDGEFWMSYTDWVSKYQWVDICHLSPQSFIDAYGQLSNTASWQINTIRGSWVRGVSAGGAGNLSMNPQVRFVLNQADDDNRDGLCSVLVALMQRASVSQENFFEIGFKVYQLDTRNNANLDDSFFNSNRPVAEFPVKGVREVAGRYELPPGVYCVVPFTYQPDKERKFMLRIYSEKGAEMDYGIGLSPDMIKSKETRPSKTPTKRTEVKKSVDKGLKEEFDKVSGVDKEVDWKELKNVLDNTVKKSIAPKEKNEGWGHFLIDTVTSVYDYVFNIKPKVNAFKTIGPSGFSKAVCRSMLAAVDVDHTGKLNFNEYHGLWTEIYKWKSIYEDHSDKSGFMNTSEIKGALEAAGLTINKQILSDIIYRYSTKDEKISFDDFLHCTIKAKAMTDYFNSKDKSGSHKAAFTMEEFIGKALYS